MRLVTIIGTRPEIIRLSSSLKAFDQYFDHKLIHTGQNYDYELNEIFFKDLNLRKPDYFLNSADSSALKTMANIISKLDDLLYELSPDAVFILGDTNSSIAGIVAKRKKIPLFHFEAGNRCFDQRVPEEINRRLIDHIADINLTYSDISRQYLINEGLPSDLIIKVGSPMYEVINHNIKKIKSSKILKIMNLLKKQYILVSIHREENVDSDDNLSIIYDTLQLIFSKYKKRILISLHPRTKKRFEEKKMFFNKNFIISKPFNFTDYCSLQTNAFFVISDSGTINEEASILKFKAINIRDNHERPESSEEAITITTGINMESIIEACDLTIKQPIKSIKLVNDYKFDNVSIKLVKLIQTYTSYINKVVWKNY